MSSPQMTRMFGFFCAVWAIAGAHSSRGHQEGEDSRDGAAHGVSPAVPASPLEAGTRLVDCGYSNAKIFFQSFFMLMTVQPFFFASS